MVTSPKRSPPRATGTARPRLQPYSAGARKASRSRRELPVAQDIAERKRLAIDPQRVDDRVPLNETRSHVIVYPRLRPFGDKHHISRAFGEVDFAASESNDFKSRDRLLKQGRARGHRQGNRIWNSAATLAGFCVSGEMDFTGSRMIRGAGECFGSLYRMLERFGRPSHWQCGAA